MQKRSTCNGFTANGRSKRNSRCNFNRCAIKLVQWIYIFFIFALIRIQIMLWIVKWHRSFFTNGDIVDLLTAMTISESVQDQHDLFYDIVTSRCPTTTKKIQVVWKGDENQIENWTEKVAPPPKRLINFIERFMIHDINIFVVSLFCIYYWKQCCDCVRRYWYFISGKNI